MLLDDFMQTCTKRIPTSVSDGMGGQTITWVNGSTFQGAIVKKTAAEREIAQKASVYSSYTLTVKNGAVIAFHEVFKTADGREFRVVTKTADVAGDNTPPARASFTFSQADVEEFVE